MSKLLLKLYNHDIKLKSRDHEIIYTKNIFYKIIEKDYLRCNKNKFAFL